MAAVYLSLGSNQDRERHLAAALLALRQGFGVVTCSSVYESPAVGGAGAPYYNLAARLDTAASPQTVQAACKAIERRAGRVPGITATHCPLDIDLLLHGATVLDDPALTLPRPGFTALAHVLAPLAELAPTLRHPVSGDSMLALWSRFDTTASRLERLCPQRTPWLRQALGG